MSAARILSAALLCAATTLAWGQAGLRADFAQHANWLENCFSRPAGAGRIYLGLVLTPVRPFPDDQLAALTAAGSPLRKHLERKDTYSLTTDWPSVSALQPLTENPPFVLVEDPRVEVNAAGVHRICLLGTNRGRTRGEVHVKEMPASSGITLAVHRPKPPPEVEPRTLDTSDLSIWYTTHEDVPLPKLRRSVDVGTGSGGPTLEIAYAGLIGGRPNKEEAAPRLLELSLSGRIPLGTPKDVQNTPGAQNDASEQVADMLTAELAWISYDRKWGLQRAGGRVRATGSGEGVELTGFYSPFMLWIDGSRSLIAAEGELGWREGNAEFKNLTTRAPDRGNLVARIGAVAEWAPEFLGVNRNLSEGLRFFVRGRGWLDTYDKDDGKRSVRFARFVDSEFFYNFEKDSRVFLRAEYGELPPDLSNRTRRIFVGVGQAF